MPKTGFSSITVSSEIYQKLQQAMNKANEKAGYKKYRSITHFVEESIVNYACKQTK
jgi:hypothetical protein